MTGVILLGREQFAHGLADSASHIFEIGRACVGKECRSRWSPYH